MQVSTYYVVETDDGGELTLSSEEACQLYERLGELLGRDKCFPDVTPKWAQPGSER